MSQRTSAADSSRNIKTDIPGRMDRLPWSRWHWLVVCALGITWILDGLEVTIVGAVGSVLTEKSTLAFSTTDVGFAASSYIAGAVIGSLFFGYLTDIFGRKRLFLYTLAVYIIATILTGFSWNLASFALFRFFTGLGIGGEYSAINSAIDEMIPARVRGWTDLAINGSYWIGTIIGASATIILLNPSFFPITLGWRLSFGFGGILGIGVLLIRRYLPESPRWLMTHGRIDEAEEIVKGIEAKVKEEKGLQQLPPPNKRITIRTRQRVGFGTIARTLFGQYPKRTTLGLWLFIGQAFLYNGIFFTYALVLKNFYGVPSDMVGYYLIAFAVGNVAGPWTIGRLFDTIGRKKMITFTYVFSGSLLAVVGYLFSLGLLNAMTQTLAWSVIFFFASAGASSAYLTVSEVFPLEIRALAIAFFYAVGTGLGGFVAPLYYGYLMGTGSAVMMFQGYSVGAILMIIGGIAEAFFGVPAERKSLESIATPLSAEGGEEDYHEEQSTTSR